MGGSDPCSAATNARVSEGNGVSSFSCAGPFAVRVDFQVECPNSPFNIRMFNTLAEVQSYGACQRVSAASVWNVPRCSGSTTFYGTTNTSFMVLECATATTCDMYFNIQSTCTFHAIEPLFYVSCVGIGLAVLLLLGCVVALLFSACCLRVPFKSAVLLAVWMIVVGSVMLITFWTLMLLMTMVPFQDPRVIPFSTVCRVFALAMTLVFYLVQLIIIYQWVAAIQFANDVAEKVITRIRVAFYIFGIFFIVAYGVFIGAFWFPNWTASGSVIFAGVFNGVVYLFQLILNFMFLFFGCFILRNQRGTQKSRSNIVKILLVLILFIFFNVLRLADGIVTFIFSFNVSLDNMQVYPGAFYFLPRGTPNFVAVLYFLIQYVFALTIPNFAILFVVFTSVFFEQAKRRKKGVTSRSKTSSTSSKTSPLSDLDDDDSLSKEVPLLDASSSRAGSDKYDI